MILPLLKKPRTTQPNMRLRISVRRCSLFRRLAVVSSVGLLMLSSATPRADAAGELKWSRPLAARRVVQRRPSERVANYQPQAMRRDPAVVSAVWAEDDGFVASNVVTVQAVEDRSVVVRRSTTRRMPPRDRIAQLPNDPFDESVDEPALELEIEAPSIEEIKEEIEQEVDRRVGEQDLSDQNLSDQDLFGDSPGEESSVEDDFAEQDEPEEVFEEQDLFADEAMDEEPEVTEVDPFDEPLVEQLPEPRGADSIIDEAEEAIEPEGDDFQTDREAFDKAFGESNDLDSENLSELFEKETEQGESDESTVLEGEKEEQDVDVDSERDLEVDPTGDLHEDKSEEQIEADRNCAEEIAKVRSDRIDDIELNINLEGDEGEDFPFECRLDEGLHQPRQWPQITYNWKAAALCHKPLYFEQVHLERYGHSWGPYVQPVMSGVHFFGTLPILPYKMGIRTPTECVYTLGYYRPGSCAPYLIDPIPFTWRAAAFQGGVATGLSFIIP